MIFLNILILHIQKDIPLSKGIIKDNNIRDISTSSSRKMENAECSTSQKHYYCSASNNHRYRFFDSR